MLLIVLSVDAQAYKQERDILYTTKTDAYAPARPWYINQNDNVLTLPDFEEDYTLQLLDEDGYVVYSVDSLSGTTQVVLPSTLTGDYDSSFGSKIP